MDVFHVVNTETWAGTICGDRQNAALAALEAGQVVVVPDLSFELTVREKHFLTPKIVSKSKNVSYNPANGKLGGTILSGDEANLLKAMIHRFSRQAGDLVRKIFPHYSASMSQGRTSLRPVEIAGRSSSWRKDDTRLHVDAFPSAPTQGRRILRVFSNVNPNGRPRTWRVGEPFTNVAQRFWPKLRPPVWGSSALLRLFGVTRAYRSEYDHFMLKLHDAMKQDNEYQQSVSQVIHEFAPGCTWICYTDQVSHAALSGIHQLEQTFMVPVRGLHNERTSPLRVMEQLAGRALV